MMTNYEDMVKLVFEKIGEEYTKMGHVNIIVAGKTGVGKTTLINAIFGRKIEKTGVGKPITQELKEITVPNHPVRLYDTVGLELNADQQEKVRNDIIGLIDSKRRSGDQDSFIHCIWYCINANSNRIEEEEIRFISDLATQSDIPVILILTQSYGKNSIELKSYVDNLNLPVQKTFRVLASDYEVDEDYTKKAFGCEDVVEFVIEILPETAQKAFINAQVASLKAKRQRAQLIITGAVAGAFGECFIPLPFADAATLVPTQIAMIAGITAVYGMDIKKSTMTAIISALLGGTGATIVGRTIVGNLLKLIPVVGSGLGGVISGSTAAVITVALGETYVGLMELMMKGELSEQQIQNGEYLEQMKQTFREKLTHSNPEEY